MLTDTQCKVLIALNDHIESVGSLMQLGPDVPMPVMLGDLRLIDAELYQAVADLEALGLIVGITPEEFDHPTAVTSVTAIGRQEIQRCRARPR